MDPRKLNIPITKPYFDPEDIRSVGLPLETGWIVQGPFVKQFEEKFSEFTGAAFSVATSSCTTALHIAVTALGLKPGDEVIVPAFTWVATPNVVEYMGAKPVFCDIDLQTFNMDPAHVETLITGRTVGIIPVHLFGLCADMNAIMTIARKHRLWLIEDAACGFGAYYQGKHAGTFGEMGCFSFHPRKSITTGEGGMITTGDKNLAALARALRDHGASRSDLERHEGEAGFLLPQYNYLGYNYRMTDIQGALGCAQMEKAKWILEKRATLARNYDKWLAEATWLQKPTVPEGYVHGYQAYVCLFATEPPTMENVHYLNRKRNELMRRLEEKGIATRQGTHAPVTQGYYVKKYNFQPQQFPSAYLAENLSLALPLYPQMTRSEQKQVVSTLLQTYMELGDG